MSHDELLDRIVSDPGVGGGQPRVRGTRIPIAVLLDGLAEGLSPGELVDHYPQLSPADVSGALACAAELSKENVWKVAVG